jgi:hypothetical protein
LTAKKKNPSANSPPANNTAANRSRAGADDKLSMVSAASTKKSAVHQQAETTSGETDFDRSEGSICSFWGAFIIASLSLGTHCISGPGGGQRGNIAGMSPLGDSIVISHSINKFPYIVIIATYTKPIFFTS